MLPGSNSSMPSRRAGKTFGTKGNPIAYSSRGHSDARFALLPSALRFRWTTALTNNEQVSYELGAIQDFFWLAD